MHARNLNLLECISRTTERVGATESSIAKYATSPGAETRRRTRELGIRGCTLNAGRRTAIPDPKARPGPDLCGVTSPASSPPFFNMSRTLSIGNEGPRAISFALGPIYLLRNPR